MSGQSDEEERRQRVTVIAEFDAGISEATMHALADEILKYRRAVRLLAKAVGWADVGAPFALIAHAGGTLTPFVSKSAALAGLCERAANSPGEIRGLCVPLGDFCRPSVPFRLQRGGLSTVDKPRFHRHFRAVLSGCQNHVRQCPMLTV